MHYGSWEIDEQTLLPKILDLKAFRSEFHDDPYLPAIEALWSGFPEKVPQLLKAETTPRARILIAESYARAGNYETSFALFSDLINEFAETKHEAVIRQHSGKALFLAQKYAEAGVQFKLALEIRKSSGAADELVQSSKLALERCEAEM